MKRRIFGAGALAVACALVATVGGGALAQEKKFRVGVSIPEAQNPFYIQVGRSIVDTLKERGIEPILVSANADVAEQINNIGDLIAAKVDSILISPLNIEGPAPAVQRAFDAKIPIFMFARTLDPKYKHLWRTFVGYNFLELGALKAKWVVESSKPGKIAMLLGPAGALFSVDQDKGFRPEIDKAGFRVVFAQNSTLTRENGLKLAEDALVAHRDLAAIYAANDDLALGAVQAVKAAGLLGKVNVIGTNGAPPALASIHNGELNATVLLDPIGLGRTAATVAADFLLKKQDPPIFIDSPRELVTVKNAYDKIPPPLRERLGVKPR